MIVINILAVLFGVPFGFGLAFWVGATLLNKSNSFGDSHGAASLYSSGVTFTDKEDKMKVSEVARQEYIDHHIPKKAAYKVAPRGLDLIERPKD